MKKVNGTPVNVRKRARSVQVKELGPMRLGPLGTLLDWREFNERALRALGAVPLRGVRLSRNGLDALGFDIAALASRDWPKVGVPIPAVQRRDWRLGDY